jgi:hypothetical protein
MNYKFITLAALLLLGFILSSHASVIEDNLLEALNGKHYPLFYKYDILLDKRFLDSSAAGSG